MAGPTVSHVGASAYRVATDSPESDGTLAWDSTTIVVAEVEAGGHCGLGYTYGAAALTRIIGDELAPVVTGTDPAASARTWQAMSARLRNMGRPGAGMMAIAAVDVALWDLHARLLDTPLCSLLGPARGEVPIYGSGGFTSYAPDRVAEQLGGWAACGIPRVKMKVGREPEQDPARLDAARRAIGDDVALFVDANGAFAPKQALDWAERYRSEWDVTWFEEPVSSDDLHGLHLVREHGPAGMDVAAGEYGFIARGLRRAARMRRRRLSPS